MRSRATIKRMRESPRVDRELTKLRHETGDYKHADSVVHIDGKEYLFGEDLTRRRMEVWERDRRRCVKCGVYVSFELMDMDHRAANFGGRRFDNLENLQTMCGPFQNGCHRGSKQAKHA